jgi:hypothetical protein
VDFFGIAGPIAKILTSVFIIAFSYVSQRNYSFKTEKEEE